MRLTIAASIFLVASTALGNAQIAVIDGATWTSRKRTPKTPTP